MPRRARGPATRPDVLILGAGHRIGSQNVPSDVLSVESDAPGPDLVSEATRAQTGRLLDHWEMWFPARPGPWRKRTATVAGHKISGRVQIDELPPTQNDRLHYRVKGPWVKEWREAARDMARIKGYTRLERVRISMIVYRPRLGVADPDNDWARIKPLLDGLRDAGALAKDTYGNVVLGTIEERRGDHGILLIVDELEPVARPEQARPDGE